MSAAVVILKAFNKVRHRALLNKPYSYGLSTQLCTALRASYMTDIDGISQGSVPSGTLLLPLTNDFLCQSMTVVLSFRNSKILLTN